jgi:quercetin dioxygenase-like cupin family protein
VKPTHVRRADVQRQPGKVMEEGGDLRVLQGSDHGLSFSVYDADVVPGGGARRHRHPHAEVFVMHGGRARFEVDGTMFDAAPGDIVLVPAGAWHGFVNTGDGPHHHIAIHDNQRAVTEFEDGTRRD